MNVLEQSFISVVAQGDDGAEEGADDLDVVGQQIEEVLRLDRQHATIRYRRRVTETRPAREDVEHTEATVREIEDFFAIAGADTIAPLATGGPVSLNPFDQKDRTRNG